MSTLTTVVAFIDALPNFDGFSRTIDEKHDRWHDATMGIIEWESPTVKIRIDGLRMYDGKVDFSGHTSYQYNGQWVCFDRYGVDDSFYPPYREALTADTLRVLVADEIQRCADAIAKNESDPPVPVPEIGYRVRRSALAGKKATLKKGKSVSFMPSGFGIGKVLTTRGNRYRKRGSDELAKFFEVPSIWIEEVECD